MSMEGLLTRTALGVLEGKSRQNQPLSIVGRSLVNHMSRSLTVSSPEEEKCSDNTVALTLTAEKKEPRCLE